LDAAKVAAVVIVEGPPSGTTAAEWVAKARQESSFREDVINVGAGKRHVGLFQIQETHAGTLTESAFLNPDQYVKWLKDPKNNFRAAKALYKASKWKPWDPSGGKPTPTAADKKAVTDATDVIKNIGAGNALDDALGTVEDIAGGVADVFGSVPEALSAFLRYVRAAYDWVSDRGNVGRVLMVGIGSVVTIGALLALAKPAISSTTSTVTGRGS